MTQKIIAIIGPRRSGKTTVAEEIKVRNPDYAVWRMWTFAIASYCRTQGITIDEFYHSHTKELNRSLLGAHSDHMRNKDPETFLRPILEHLKNQPKIIFDDIYYFNELESLIKLGAHVLYVHSPNHIRQNCGLTATMPNHVLEMEVNSIQPGNLKYWKNTTVIENNKNLDALREQVRRLQGMFE